MLEDASLDQYAYLLGLYLGDGHLARAERGVYRLRLYLDSSYPTIVREARAAIRSVMPRNRVGLAPRTGSLCVVVYCSSKHWPTLFPQHGPGKKHLRRILLTPWQRAITHSNTEAFVRGLIHSDGCRFIAHQRQHGRTYPYARYEFSNRSPDIRSLLVEHLELLGIRWTRSSRFKVQVARREDVAALDSFIGPKS